MSKILLAAGSGEPCALDRGSEFVALGLGKGYVNFPRLWLWPSFYLILRFQTRTHAIVRLHAGLIAWNPISAPLLVVLKLPPLRFLLLVYYPPG